MSEVRFEIKPHSVRPNTQVVEVWIDGACCATITPGEVGEKTIRVMSAHFAGDRGVLEFPTGTKMAPVGALRIPIPVLQVAFDIRPYRIEGDQLIRL